MWEGYKENVLNMHGLKSLVKSPVMPNPNLAIAGDDEMANVGLRIFVDQHLPMPGPVLDKITNQSYEKVAAKGKNDVLTADNFVMDDFDLGPAIAYD